MGVGIVAAAQSDRVKAEFQELGLDIKMDLADAAAPLEDSLIHASGVARDVFAKLKPILSDVFSDVGPELDGFVDDMGGMVGRISTSFRPLGRAFGTLLDAIGDKADIMGDNLGDAIETLADTTEEHADDIAALFTMVTTSIKWTAEAIGWLSDKYSEFLTVNEVLHRELLGINVDYDQSGNKLGRMNEAMEEAIRAAQGLGTETNNSETAIRNLSDALESFFNPAAEALDAEIRLKEAIKETTEAAKTQGLSEIDRLKNVQSLTGAIAKSAEAEKEATGQTKSATAAFEANIGKLITMAGKNENAKATVNGLATALGYTITKTKSATYAVDRYGNVIKVLPSGKTTKLKADTKAAKAALAALKAELAKIRSKSVTVTVRTVGNTSIYQAGNVKASTREIGGIDRYAAGGVRRTTAPNITARPTILYGEGNGDEAFIPYDPKYRKRATKILNQVASDFGMTKAMQVQASIGGGGSSAVDVRLLFDGRGMDSELMTMLRKRIRVEGGGDVQKALGKG